MSSTSASFCAPVANMTPVRTGIPDAPSSLPTPTISHFPSPSRLHPEPTSPSMPSDMDASALREAIHATMARIHTCEELTQDTHTNLTTTLISVYEEERVHEQHVVDFYNSFIEKFGQSLDANPSQGTIWNIQVEAMADLRCAQRASEMVRESRTVVEKLRSQLARVQKDCFNTLNEMNRDLVALAMQALDLTDATAAESELGGDLVENDVSEEIIADKGKGEDLDDIVAGVEAMTVKENVEDEDHKTVANVDGVGKRKKRRKRTGQDGKRGGPRTTS